LSLRNYLLLWATVHKRSVAFYLTLVDDLLQANAFLIHHRQTQDVPQVIEARRAVFMEHFNKLFNQFPKSEADIRKIVNSPAPPLRHTRVAGILGTGKDLHLKFQSSNGSCLDYRVKYNTPLEKLFSDYAKKKGVNRNSFMFMFDGTRLESFKTPGDYNMEDGDIIEAIPIMLGC
jgi:hypothetical protein